MSVDQIHLGDIGTEFQVRILDENKAVVNVASATTKSIIFRKPSGSKVVKSASFVTDGRDGYIMYTATSGDINEKGLWKIQGQVAFGSNVLNSSTVGTFKVYANL
jgi:hypothetical protein